MILSRKELKVLSMYNGFVFNEEVKELAFPVFVVENGEVKNVSNRTNVRINNEKVDLPISISKESLTILSKGKEGGVVVSKKKTAELDIKTEQEAVRFILEDLHMITEEIYLAKEVTKKELYQAGQLELSDLNFQDTKFKEKNMNFIKRLLEGNFTDVFMLEDNEEFMVLEVDGAIPHVCPTRILMELFEERNLQFLTEGKRQVELDVFENMYHNYFITIVR